MISSYFLFFLSLNHRIFSNDPTEHNAKNVLYPYLVCDDISLPDLIDLIIFSYTHVVLFFCVISKSIGISTEHPVKPV